MRKKLYSTNYKAIHRQASVFRVHMSNILFRDKTNKVIWNKERIYAIVVLYFTIYNARFRVTSSCIHNNMSALKPLIVFGKKARHQEIKPFYKSI